MKDGCPFCDYAGPSPILADYGLVYLIEPLNPVVPGHVLVIPKKHIEHGAWNSSSVTGEAFGYAHDWALGQAWPDFNLIASRGPAATQTIAHIHVHALPRRFGDGLRLPWSP